MRAGSSFSSRQQPTSSRSPPVRSPSPSCRRMTRIAAATKKVIDRSLVFGKINELSGRWRRFFGSSFNRALLSLGAVAQERSAELTKRPKSMTENSRTFWDVKCKVVVRVLKDQYVTCKVLAKGRPDMPLDQRNLPHFFDEAFKLEIRIRDRGIVFRRRESFSAILKARDVDRILKEGYILEYYIKTISELAAHDLGEASITKNFIDSASLMGVFRQNVFPTGTCPKF